VEERAIYGRDKNVSKTPFLAPQARAQRSAERMPNPLPNYLFLNQIATLSLFLIEIAHAE
jgi:hypothetical protein